MRQRFAILIILSLIAILAACRNSSTGRDPFDPQELIVEGRDIAFFPETVEVVVGRPVHLTLKNVGALEHEINIDDLPMKEGSISVGGMTRDEDEHGHQTGEDDMPAGGANAGLHLHAGGRESVSATLTPLEPGTYEIYCGVPGHREAGMVARFVVQQG